mmetsp:Transcript_76961/g.89445  ORF Transcript_76961/g.89445 Transcript_76961/m.89445 type:complete len:344 (-) Transcript_76961:316-1347(-)
MPSTLIKHSQQDAAELRLHNRREDDGDDGHQLDQNVQSGTRRVLERITHSVTNHSSSVLRGPLALVLVAQSALLDVLLGIVPRTAGVRARHGHLHARHNGAGQQTSKGVLAEQNSGDDRREEHEARGGHHLVQRSLRGDRHACLVVGLLRAVRDLRVLELTADLVHHVHRGNANRLHRHGGEPVRQHRTNEQTGHHTLVKDVHRRDLHARDERAVQRERNERSRADREPLSDSGGRVAGGVEGVRHFADLVTHVRHLGEASGIVGDWAVRVDRQANAHRRQDTEGCQRVAVQVRHPVARVDRDGHRKARRQHGHVPQGKAVDDVRCGTGLARLGDLLHRAVRV